MFCLNRLRRIRRDEDGVITVELAIIAPLFLMLVIGVFEISQYQMLQGEVHHAVRNIGRRLSVGDIQQADAITEITSALSPWGGAPTTTINDDGVNVTIAVTMPTTGMTQFSYLAAWASMTADATLTFRKE